MPVVHENDNLIYRWLVGWLTSALSGVPVLFSLITFALLFTQATLLNRICNSIRLLPRPNYLVGMAYLLLTSLSKEGSQFSAPLLVNFCMIWVWYKMIKLYGNSAPKTSVYDIAVLVGLMPLIYSPALALVLLLGAALITTRPFHITEWMVALLGLITPYYFLGIILYLTGHFQANSIVPFMKLHMPHVPVLWWIGATIGLMALPVLMGAYYVQNSLGKTVIQVRKAWGLLIMFLLVAAVIALSGQRGSMTNWVLAFIPLAAFHGAAYFYIPSRGVAAFLHWVIFILAIFVNYYL